MMESNPCFISYRHPNDANAKKFVETFVEELSAQLQMFLPTGVPFFDIKGVQVGDKFNDRLAMALCRSASLVICYGPRYFDQSHPFCAREYLGMRKLETLRHDRMQRYLGGKGLIFPVVFRGYESLPDELRGYRHCLRLDDVVQPSDLRRRSRREKIRSLAEEIYKCHDGFDRSGLLANYDCSRFSLPVAEADEWLRENFAHTRTPMPGR
jgi:hypothetical protein